MEEEHITLQSQLMTRLLVLETKLISNEKVYDKLFQNVSDINEKKDNLRYEVQSLRHLPEVAKKVTDLETQISSVKLELAESSWIKKIVSGVVGLILVAVITTFVNITLSNNNNNNNKIDILLEKLNNEYTKH
jgi:DNA repair exonuclease SbcCD ATPase subunit